VVAAGLLAWHNSFTGPFVFDDGWDDPRTLWGFDAGFPNGFLPLKRAATPYHSAVGVWLSPFGGYGQAKEERLKYGRTQGFETNSHGFALAGPKYYARFRDACRQMIEKYGVNYFKFDGIASGMYANGAGADYLLTVKKNRKTVKEAIEKIIPAPEAGFPPSSPNADPSLDGGME